MTKIRKDFSDFKYNKFNPSVNEWLNSIYNFDRNNLNTLCNSKIIYNIINSYFNIKPNNISILKKNTKLLPLKRIYVSIPEIKNSLNNCNITVYVFNKEKLIFNKKITKLQRIQFNNLSKYKSLNKELFNDLNVISSRKAVNLNNKLLKTLNTFTSLKTYINIFSRNFNLKINKEIIKILYIKIHKKFFKNIYKNIPYVILFKRNYKNNLIKKDKFYFFMKNHLANIRKKIKKEYYILFFYKRYVTRIYFNRLKFNYINLFNLNKIFHNIYDKRVNISIINLKYLHLDYSIFINAIVRKIKKKKSKILRVLRKALIFPKIPKINSMYLLRKEYNEIIDVLYNINNFNEYLNIKNIKQVIFKSLKSIHIVGVRLEGKGRLTKRFTASRSVYKKAYKGSLKNVYSSYKGFSAVMSKGLYGSNINYINLNSYKRIGSYGIKNWQNTM